MADNAREGDLILAPNEFAFISDQTTGRLNVMVGPLKDSLGSTDQPMRYEETTQKYVRCNLRDAIQTFPYANEMSYIVLQNPSKADADGNDQHPKQSAKNPLVDLEYGKSINIQGPAMFPLWAGQVAKVVAGHQLRSNQYLVIKVVNEEQARQNWKDTTVKTTEGEASLDQSSFDLKTGQLNIIRGTDVSFYIPPTGIDVVRDEDGSYVREALTLEMLEYCILKDENGEKRYERGPSVVFPEATEDWVTKSGGGRKFKAVELNENMGLYIKVISDYKDGETEIEAGEELFITGSEMKIYYPRPEHAIIKYGNQIIHYAVAIPAGEARYCLDKNSGEVSLIQGPRMFLANPKKHVIVNRVLNEYECALWYPGNREALEFNVRASGKKTGDSGYYESDTSAKKNLTAGQYSRSTVRMYDDDLLNDFADGMKRSKEFTPPRTITLDTKYDGAVQINVWPGFAVQVVKKTGERRVVTGPSSILLGYDESLEVLKLSKGKPKDDHDTFKTVYLKSSNNLVSDIVRAETQDLVNVDVEVSYRVNFEGDQKKWFNVENYVKFLADHMRSIVRNCVKKHGIESFHENYIDIIRDTILGPVKEGKPREGRSFAENGMKIYDVEVLHITIGDASIKKILVDAQHRAVSNTLMVQHATTELDVTKKLEAIKREKTGEVTKTFMKQQESQDSVDAAKRESDKARMKFDAEKQIHEDDIAESLRAQLAADKEIEVLDLESRAAVITKAIVERNKAISPQLIEAINTLGDKKLAGELAAALPKATGTNGFMFGAGGFKGLLDMVQGTPFEKTLKQLTKQEESKDAPAE